MIHMSKLKNQIFGDASKMFETSAAVNTNQLAAKAILQRPLPASSGMNINSQITTARATDTNRNVALQLLQVYTKRFVSKNECCTFFS